jgi:uncharacterized membrane protein YoaK (UPF0700 family)
MVDVTSWMTSSGLFAAHITGNLVVGAADLLRGVLPSLAALLAVVVFIVAAALTNLLAKRLGSNQRSVLWPLLLLQTVLLTLSALLDALGKPTLVPHSLITLLVGISAVAAMAVQNALLHLTRKQAPTTAVMTDNLVVATLALTDL